jgi:simple sugar transport system permease protein
MNEFLTYNFISGFLSGLVRIGTPILIVALGELISQRSGVINLGVEGIMLAGSFAGFYVCFLLNSPCLGVIAAIITGGVLGLIMALLSVRLRANQIVAGIGIWIFCQGMVGFAFRRAFGIIFIPPTIEGMADLPIPLLSRIPLIGEVFFTQSILVYFSWVLVPAIYFFLKYTSWGLKLRSVGENPAVAEAAGVNYMLVRHLAVIFGGAMAGLGGAFMALNVLRFFTDNMIVGLGFMAVAVVFFSRWRPVWVLLGAFIFAASSALQFRLQAMKFPLDYHILLMFPYIATVLVLVLFVRGEEEPGALGSAYEKER